VKEIAMDQSDDDAPRKKRRTTAKDDRPHVRQRGAKKKRSLAWYQHLSIVIPLAACVIFAVLIGGTMTVRQIIYQVHQPAEQASASTPVTEGAPAATSPSWTTEQPAIADSNFSPEKEAARPTQVAAALANHKEGMKLGKMLLVGPGKDMLPTITDALKLANPGDVIEVRTNGPLLELGTELKRETRVENAPITIRNGDGFQPVVRVNWSALQGLVIAKNVDVIVSGLHCVTNRPATFLRAEQGNVVIRDCSFTCPYPKTSFRAVYLNNFLSRFNGDTNSFHATIEHCFFRDSQFCVMGGPRLSVEVTDCGYIGLRAPSLFSCSVNEQNRITINRCTMINSNVLTIDNPEVSQRQMPPLAYHIDQSVLGSIVNSTMLITITNTQTFRAFNEQDAIDKFSNMVHFEGRSSVRQLASFPEDTRFMGVWGFISDSYLTDITRIPTLPTIDQSLKFGPGIEEMRRLWTIARNVDAAMALGWTLLPDQLETTSTGPLAELRNAGLQVGCNVALLPVPPPATLEPYPAQ
jgi:hypothetical protein